MTPSVASETNESLPSRSTVAQRKEANELRRVSGIWRPIDSPSIAGTFCHPISENFPVTNVHFVFFLRLSSPCWKRKGEHASTTALDIWRPLSCLLLAKTTLVTRNSRKQIFSRWPYDSSQIFLQLQSKVSFISETICYVFITAYFPKW